MLKITRKTVDEMFAHGRAEAPLEACGYLAAKDGVICRSIAMRNMDRSPVHYSMDPTEQFAAMRRCRAEGLRIMAVYHSHPETEAFPSAEDIRLAYDPGLSYVIVSLAGTTPVINSFTIQNETVSKERIEIIGEEK